MTTQMEKLRAIAESRDPSLALHRVLNEQAIAKFLSKLELMKGDNGEDGYTPIKGVDYFTDDELKSIIDYLQSTIKDGEQGPSGPQGISGKDGRTPIRLIDYWTKEDQTKIVSDVLKQIKPAKDGVSPKIEDIIKLVLKEIKLPDTKSFVTETKLSEFLRRGGFRGGGDTVEAGTGISISINGNGQKVITNTGASSTTYSETPTGAINSINKAFHTNHTITFIFGIYMNGQFIHPADYSFTGTTITWVTAPDISYSGLPFTVIYN